MHTYKCNGYERLTVLKMFSRLFCFEQVKALKNFSEKLYTSKVKKKLKKPPETDEK